MKYWSEMNKTWGGISPLKRDEKSIEIGGEKLKA
jgi:hypothetical protein